MAFRVLDVDPFGPLIQVGVRVGTSLANAGLGGAPRSYTALIDTGASVTAISPAVTIALQPRQAGFASVDRIGANLLTRAFEIQIKFEHHLQPGTWHTLKAVEVDPVTPGVDVLIGRDLLKEVKLLYDGSAGKLVLMH